MTVQKNSPCALGQLISICAAFLNVVGEYLTRSNLREEGFVLALSSRRESIVSGKLGGRSGPWLPWQECEAASSRLCGSESREGGDGGSQLYFSFSLAGPQPMG